MTPFERGCVFGQGRCECMPVCVCVCGQCVCVCVGSVCVCVGSVCVHAYLRVSTSVDE